MGRSITVDAGPIIFNGTDEDTNVLSVTGDGDSAGALIAFSHTTNTRNDLLGTGSTWSMTGQGYLTAVRVYASAYVSTASAVDLVLHTNDGSNSSQITITDASNGDITFAMDGTGGVVISGTTETNPSLTLTNGDLVVSDGSITLTDDDTAPTMTLTNTAAFLDGSGAGVVTIVADSLTTGRALDINADGLTTGKILHLDMTEAGATDGTGMYIECFDGTAGSAQFTVGLNGDTTITGATGTDVFTISAGDLVISDGSITLTDGDDNPSLIVTNNTATSSDVFAIVGSGTFTGTGASAFCRITASGLTSGDGFSITTDAMTSGTALLLDSSGTIVTTGAMLEILADSATTADGLIRMTADALTTGIGLLLTTTANAAAAAQLLNIDHTVAALTVAKTGQLVDIVSSRTQTANQTVSDDYDVLSVIRTSVHNDASGTLNAAGSVLRLENVATQTQGTLADTVIGLEIVMDVDGTGPGMRITHSATGAVALDVVTAVTSVDGVLITGSGVQANNTGVLHVTSSGATAAGSSILRVTATGTPASNTSYLLELDYTGATEETNDPVCMHIDRGQSDEAAIQITGSVADVGNSGAVSVFQTDTGATGVVFHTQHTSTGSAAVGDAVFTHKYEGLDSGNAVTEYCRLEAEIMLATAGSEDGRFIFSCAADNGTLTQMVQISPRAGGSVGQLVVGSGSGVGRITTLSTQDLVLDTNEGTNAGNITLTDAANGNITLTPNGSGAVDIAGALLHSETTTSSGAGAISVTGTIHEITTSGTGDAMTLVNGTEGQILHVVYVAEGAGSNTAVLTPTSFQDTTITFTDLGESVTLLYTAASWYVVGNGGTTIA